MITKLKGFMTLSDILKLTGFKQVKEYLGTVGIGLTQLLNTLLGGWPDESVSSRLWRLEQQGSSVGTWCRQLVDKLFWWQRGHCELAYEAERKRYQSPPILR